MTHEEKVLYLFKIAVESAVQYKTTSASRSFTTIEDTVENFYAKFEVLLDKKLNTESGQ